MKLKIDAQYRKIRFCVKIYGGNVYKNGYNDRATAKIKILSAINVNNHLNTRMHMLKNWLLFSCEKLEFLFESCIINLPSRHCDTRMLEGEKQSKYLEMKNIN